MQSTLSVELSFMDTAHSPQLMGFFKMLYFACRTLLLCVDISVGLLSSLQVSVYQDYRLVLEMVFILPFQYAPESQLVRLFSSGEKYRGNKPQTKLCLFHMHIIKASQVFLSNFCQNTCASFRSKLMFDCLLFQYFYLIISMM